MNLPFWIARKYLYSGKVRNVIHILSLISLFGITVGAIALIVILSIFNGFEDVVISLYNSFDSDIRITSENSKYFEIDSNKIAGLKKIRQIGYLTGVIEENALVRNKQNQTIALLKAIDTDYIKSTGIDSMILFGEASLKSESGNNAVIGSGVAAKLGINLFENAAVLQVYFPRKGNPNKYLLQPEKAFCIKNILPSGIFSIQQDFDSKYILVPLGFMRELVGENYKITAFEINLKNKNDLRMVRHKVSKILGNGYIIKDRFEQHTWLYKIMRSEKFMVFLILSFILLIAAFNLVGSLLMLSLEKKSDMVVLKSMGADESQIKKIIFYQGLILSFAAAIIGLIGGAIICILQMKYKLVKLNSSGTFVLDAYPVSLRVSDFIWVFIVVLVIGFISSYFPARATYRELTLSDLHK